MQQLQQDRARLEENNARIASRLALKRELMEMFKAGELELEGLVDHWAWLNNQKPWFPIAMGTMYFEMSPRQIAMLQILVEIEDWVMETAASEEIGDQALGLLIARDAVISGFHPLALEKSPPGSARALSP